MKEYLARYELEKDETKEKLYTSIQISFSVRMKGTHPGKNRLNNPGGTRGLSPGCTMYTYAPRRRTIYAWLPSEP